MYELFVSSAPSQRCLRFLSAPSLPPLSLGKPNVASHCLRTNFSNYSNLNVCAVGGTDTVFVTVATDASRADLSKIDASTSAPANILYDVTSARVDVSKAPASSAASSSKSPVARAQCPSHFCGHLRFLDRLADCPDLPSEVVVTSSITVLPIVLTQSTVTRTTTIRTTRWETHFHTVINALGTSAATSSSIFPSTGQDTSIQTVTSTKEPTTVTLTLLLAKPIQTNLHYPGWASSGVNTSFAPTRIPKYPATTALRSDTVLKIGTEESSLDIYQTSLFKISLSTMLAHSGFMNKPSPSEIVISSPVVSIARSYAATDSSPILTTLATSTTAASIIPSVASVPGFETRYTSIPNMETTHESSSAGSNASVLSVVPGPPTSTMAFTTLAPPRPFSSSMQYLSTPRYWNTTSRAMISNIITTPTQSAPSPAPGHCGEFGDFTLNVRSDPLSSSIRY